ncbi:MAG: hypothetical protein V1810_04745 [Candidatus Beckwithbacteria bacterium]
MTFQKNPKQKNNYPDMLAGYEKQRAGNWNRLKQKIKPNFSLRQGFVPSARKVPT